MKTLKNPKLLLAAILIGIIAIIPIPHAYSSTLTLTIFTTRPSYTIGEDITIYGNLTYNNLPVPDWPVALEVQDPVGTPVVTRTLQTNTSGTYTLTFKLPTNSKRGTYTAYVSSNYKGETATNNTRFQLIQITQTTVTIEGEDYPITIESNSTITSVTATKTQLNFTSSGPTGKTAYVNITIPTGLNKTQIKVFIDNTELIPPPYPTITTNSTHYFIYFEFALSTHNIAIEYAIADIATTNITPAKTIVGQGYTIRINATIQNQGDYTETFNVTLYANTTSITTETVTLTSGNSATITFTWNTSGFAKGNYTISAYAEPVMGETDTEDNRKEDGWVVVAIPGDFTGQGYPVYAPPDGKVDLNDQMCFVDAFFAKYGIPPPPGVNPANCDLTGQGYPPLSAPDGTVNFNDQMCFVDCFFAQYGIPPPW